MQLLPASSDKFSNADVTDDCIPQSTKHPESKNFITTETDSNNESSNPEVIADQWIAVGETSMHSESVNDSQWMR